MYFLFLILAYTTQYNAKLYIFIQKPWIAMKITASVSENRINERIFLWRKKIAEVKKSEAIKKEKELALEEVINGMDNIYLEDIFEVKIGEENLDNGSEDSFTKTVGAVESKPVDKNGFLICLVNVGFLWFFILGGMGIMYRVYVYEKPSEEDEEDFV